MNYNKILGIYLWNYPTSNSISMWGFWHKWTDRSKPNVKIKMMSPYHSAQMSTRCQIRLRCMSWQQTVPNRYIEMEFDVGYLQWYLPMVKKTLVNNFEKAAHGLKSLKFLKTRNSKLISEVGKNWFVWSNAVLANFHQISFLL